VGLKQSIEQIKQIETGVGMKTTSELRNAKLRESLDAVKSALTKIAGKEARLIIYGSYARGEEREDSDVDLMVVLPDEATDFQKEETVRDAAIDIGLENDFLFSVIVVTESQMKRFQGFKVFDSVEKEGMPV
jgi:predicted nucleotidyltransferase